MRAKEAARGVNSNRLITSLGAYNEPIDAENGVFFISIGLTPSGANHIDEITDIVFSYIDLLRSEGPQAGTTRRKPRFQNSV